jgi:hypothetical protein
MKKYLLNEASGKDFIRILGIITKVLKVWVCKIEGGVISHGVGNNLYLDLDIISLFELENVGSGPQMEQEKPEVNLCFHLENAVLKKMKACVGVGPVSIIDDHTDPYVFQTENTHRELIRACSDDGCFEPVPVIDDADYIGEEVTLDKTKLSHIKKELKAHKTTSGRLLIYGSDNQLIQFQCVGGAPYTFNKNEIEKVKGTKPTLSLNVSNFLSIVGNHEIKIRPAQKNGCYWLKTTSTSSLGVKITVFENLS